MIMTIAQNISEKELLELYGLPLDELLSEAKKYNSDTVEFCSLISARTGKCSESCRYCAQSSHYMTDIFTHPLIKIEDVIKTAKEAKENGATRFAIVTSGRGPSKADMPVMCEMIKEINKLGLKSCASLGLLDEEKAQQFKDAGLVRYHHNINTSRSYHPSITTTHTFQDRVDTINFVKKAGIEVCSGVIIGMGESVEQRVEMALNLAEIKPDSIPVNFLTPIEGTPFENYGDKIDEEGILRTLSIIKIANPKSVVRFAGGRKLRLSKENMERALDCTVNGILIGNYLTTIGIEPKEDIETLKKLGKKLYV
jgi:biotin synthase